MKTALATCQPKDPKPKYETVCAPPRKKIMVPPLVGGTEKGAQRLPLLFPRPSGYPSFIKVTL